jgi:hypothetical protein
MGIKRLYDFFQSVLMPFSFITAQVRRKTCSVEMAGLLWESLYRQEELARHMWRRAPDEAQPAVPMGDLVYERFRHSVKHRLNEIFAVFKDTGSVLVFEGNYIYLQEGAEERAEAEKRATAFNKALPTIVFQMGVLLTNFE